jgi:hypothetical protein
MLPHHKEPKLIEAGILSVISVFAPIKSLLITTAVLIGVDLVTGIMAAKRQQVPITSSGLRRSVSKLFVYNVAIMTAFLAETYVSDVLPIMKLMASLVSMTEILSIYENLNIISGNNLLSTVITKIGSNNQEKLD